MKGKVSTIIFVFSLVFSITAVVAGNSYYNRKQEVLAKEVSTLMTTETTIASEVVKTPQDESGKLTSEQKAAVDSALTKIISDNTIKGDFTLEDYQSLKAMVDELPNGTEKTRYVLEIEKIETALTNMGINYK